MDWSSVLNTFIANLPLTIGAVTGLVIAIRKIDVIHKATNSIVTQLVDKADEKGEAAGHARGVEDERARADEQGRAGRRNT